MKKKKKNGYKTEYAQAPSSSEIAVKRADSLLISQEKLITVIWCMNVD